MSSIKASKVGFSAIRLVSSLSRASVPHSTLRFPQRCYRSTVSSIYHRAAPHLPRILQPELWESIIPSSIRSTARQLFADGQKKKTNPATYFIWIYILIGSQAIRIIQTKNEHAVFTRKADQQIKKLREVIQKLQAGEEVDVEKALGTGIPEEEQAWEDALREIEEEERLWTAAQQRKKELQEVQQRTDVAEDEIKQDASPIDQTSSKTTASIGNTSVQNTASPPRPPGFY